ncbi:MAG: hypothetical protein ACON4R_16840 [Akkermansiaceae bacterium]
MSGVANDYRFVLTGRWIPEKTDAGQLFSSFRWWITKDLGLGFDYRPMVDQVTFNATFRLVSEDPKGWRPAVLLGTSYDDFSFGGEETESRSFFATVSKALPDLKFLGITPAPYFGVAWITELDDLRPLAGVNLTHQAVSLMVQYSGTDTHLTVSRRINDNLSLSAIYWGLKYPGVAFRYRF